MSSFAAIDFETATSNRDSACALGVMVVEEDGTREGHWNGEAQSWLIRPPGNVYDAFNTSIHGITPAMTENSPTFAEVWLEAEGVIGDRTLVAHNTAFDMYVLQHSAAQSRCSIQGAKFACTYRLAKDTWPSRWSYRLNDLAEDFGIELEHHDAMSDAAAAGQIVVHLCNHHGLSSVEEVADSLGYRLGYVSSETYSPFSNAKPSDRSTYSKKPNLATLEAVSDDFDPEHPLFGKVVAFTGTLEALTRAEAGQAAVDRGATAVNGVSKKVDYLIVGRTDFDRVRDGASSKLRKAVELAEAGHGLEIIDEVVFQQMVAE
ncbi:MAG: exonuclease domain-containing protein [Acidimicrobiales bacterium]|jgi:DNA polymerase-3 subunit epsilon|nr:exonuclease domain-containing protein [Acidimicrobiales bacterium]MDP6761190.1 exonuclease domain-containing protein [Acidimicrobiales bacterium]|tara:strand:+ start:267 stop:1220 length:954 start_codon:yes stop_codon:yes gene_type:complete